MTTAVAANVVLFTASMTILTDVGRFTVWAIHPSIMQRLKYGTHGLSHPALGASSYSQVQISQSNFSQPQFISAPGLATTRSATQRSATGRAKDSINVAVNWSGDMAGKVKGVASQINRGFSRFGSFFRGEN